MFPAEILDRLGRRAERPPDGARVAAALAKAEALRGGAERGRSLLKWRPPHEQRRDLEHQERRVVGWEDRVEQLAARRQTAEEAFLLVDTWDRDHAAIYREGALASREISAREALRATGSERMGERGQHPVRGLAGG